MCYVEPAFRCREHHLCGPIQVSMLEWAIEPVKPLGRSHESVYYPRQVGLEATLTLSRNEALTETYSHTLPAANMESGNHFDSSRAELFEALGHPTRVKILRTLETKPYGIQ